MPVVRAGLPILVVLVSAACDGDTSESTNGSSSEMNGGAPDSSGGANADSHGASGSGGTVASVAANGGNAPASGAGATSAASSAGDASVATDDVAQTDGSDSAGGAGGSPSIGPARGGGKEGEAGSAASESDAGQDIDAATAPPECPEVDSINQGAECASGRDCPGQDPNLPEEGLICDCEAGKWACRWQVCPTTCNAFGCPACPVGELPDGCTCEAESPPPTQNVGACYCRSEQ